MFSDMSDEQKEPWAYGKCMYLAAALHRMFDFEIMVVLTDIAGSGEAIDFENAVELIGPENSISYIQHAWAVLTVSGEYFDIDGIYQKEKSGYDCKQNGTLVVSGLNEHQLKELIRMTHGGAEINEKEWENSVQEGQQLLRNYRDDFEPLFGPAKIEVEQRSRKGIRPK